MKILKVSIILVLVSAILFALLLLFFSVTKETAPVIPATQDTTTKSVTSEEFVRNSANLLYGASTTIAEKIDVVKGLTEISKDESLDNALRVNAGELVTGTFFDFGVKLADGFSENPFSEREVFEYAQYVNSLGDSPRNSLLTAYIGLRFYSDEIDSEFVRSMILSHKRSFEQFGESNSCGNNSKLGSVLYLSEKVGFEDITKEFGDYYTQFEHTFTTICSAERKNLVGLMWLAALSDIGNTPKETIKAQELVTLITQDTTNTSRLVKNLKHSYFSTEQEPDTVSIVERLVAKYPEFKTFIETIEKSL